MKTRTMMTGKIHRATVTQADLNYVGSITVDAALRVLLVGSFGHLAQVSPKFLGFFLGSMGAKRFVQHKTDLLFV